MGNCLGKDGAKQQRMNESADKMSERTIFDPQDPYANMSSGLVQPPELTQKLEIYTFQERTVIRDSKLRTQTNQNIKGDSFLKNDTKSIMGDGNLKQHQRQAVRTKLMFEIEKSRVHQDGAENEQESHSAGHRNMRIARNNTYDFESHLERNILPLQPSFSALQSR